LLTYLIDSFSKGKYFLFASIMEVITLFIYNIYIARIFGPAVYGEIKTILAVTSIIITFFDFGFPVHLQRNAASTKIPCTDLNIILFIKLISALFYLIITVIYFFFFSSVNRFFVLIIGLSTFLLSISNLFFYLYYGKNKISLTFKFTIFSRLSLLLILIILLPFNIPVEAVLLLLMLSNLILVLFSISGLKEIKTTILLSKPSFVEIISLLKETFPLGLTTLFNFLYGKIDIVILSIMLNFVIVAQYSVAYGLYKLSGMIFSVFLIPAFNLFTQNQENKHQNARIFYTFFSIILISSSLTALLLLFPYKTRLSLLYGDKYAMAATIIPYFALAVIGLGMNSLTGSFLNASGNYNITMYTTMTGLVFNISANIILINSYGIMGAVYTAVLTETIVFLLQLFFIIKMNYDILWKRILTY